MPYLSYNNQTEKIVRLLKGDLLFHLVVKMKFSSNE